MNINDMISQRLAVAIRLPKGWEYLLAMDRTAAFTVQEKGRMTSSPRPTLAVRRSS